MYVLSGKVDTKSATSSLECGGVVTKIGAGVSDLSVGDRVVVMAPCLFATQERVPRWACAKLSENEDHQVSVSDRHLVASELMSKVDGVTTYPFRNRHLGSQTSRQYSGGRGERSSVFSKVG